MTPISIHLAVEDDLSEVMLRSLLRARPVPYAVGAVFKQGGFGYLRQKTPAFNNMAKACPVILLTDLDQRPCAPELIAEWLKQPKHPDFLLRVAVREVEAWLLACDEALGAYLAVRHFHPFPSPEELDDPKMELLRLAEGSSKRGIREAIARRDTGGKPIGEKQLPERFASPDYQVLLVASKYQTGFDQPLLCAMYVDKRLDGVQAVQTLSRLNRKIPGKESPFVLDFVNDAEEIYKAFKPYYDATSLQEGSDPQQLEALKHELDAAQVYFWSEVEAYSRIFYKPLSKQTAQDHASMQLHLQPAVDRFKALEDEAQRGEFREKLGGYVNIYSFMSQIMPYVDPALEMLYSFGRFLLPHLPLDRDLGQVKLSDEVGLQYYRLQRIYSGEIVLRDGEPEGVKSPTDVGTGKAKEEKAPLSEIIKVLNDRFGTNFTDEDRFFFEQIREKAATDDQVIKLRQANPFDKFQLGLQKLIDDLMIQRMSENDKIVTRYMDDKAFGDAAFAVLSKSIYESIPAEG